MNIFDTALAKDVLNIIEFNGNANTCCNISMDWILYGNDPFPVHRIHSVNTLRDYRESTFDIITAVVEVSVEEYQSLIYPNKARLFMDVYRTPASPSGVYNKNSARRTQYKVMILTNEDHELFDSSQVGMNSKQKENNRININVQLVHSKIYAFKDVQYSEVLGPGSLEDYIYYFMSHRGKMRCSVHPIDNKDDTDDILIPEGISLTDLPGWLQKECCGVYDHGIGAYYQDSTMYIYPIALLTPHPYRRRMMIFRTGSEVGISTGNTYAVDDGVLYMVSSGDVPAQDGGTRTTDEREALEQIHGNVVRWNDPRYQSSVIDETNDSMRYTSRGSKVFGLSDSEIKVQKIHKMNTVNSHAQRSIINKTLGRVITIPWHSGDIDRIEPGTEVTYHYMKGRSMESVQGIIDGTMESLSPQDGNPLGGIFNIHAILRIRVI